MIDTLSILSHGMASTPAEGGPVATISLETDEITLETVGDDE